MNTAVMKRISGVIFLLVGAAVSLNAAIVPEAEKALASGDTEAAIRLSKSILSDIGVTAEDSAKATLVLASALAKQGKHKESDDLARRLLSVAGV